MKLIPLLFLSIFIGVSTLQAQEILLEEEPENAYEKDKFGINRSHFVHSYYQVGYFVGRAESPMKYRTGSGDVAFGIRYKKKITRILSTGLELQTRYSYIRFRRNTAVPYLDTLFTDTSMEHRKSRLGWSALGLNGFVRFNFDPGRGNYMGYYLEFAGGPEWNFAKDFVVHDERENGMHIKTRYTRFPYINPFVYHVQARIGLNKIVLGAGYRFGNVFKAQYNLPEPPRITAQLQVSIFTE